MEEEKKRRPRVIKSDSPLEERSESVNQQDQGSEQSSWQSPNPEGDSGYQPRPYQNRYQQGGDEGGYQQRPYQNRYQQGGDGGYQQRPQRPYQDRYQQGGDGGYQQRPQRPYQDRYQQGGDGGYQQRPQRPYQDRYQQGGGTEGGGGYQQRPQRPYQDRYQQGGGGGYQQGGGGGYQQRPYQNRYQQGGDGNEGGGGGYQQRPQRPYQDRYQQGGGGGYQQGGGGGYQQRPYQNRYQQGGGGGGYQQRPYQDRYQQGGGGGYQQRPYQQRPGGDMGGRKPFNKRPKGPRKEEFIVEFRPKPDMPTGEGMPLNKFLAHCGISSRRKAVEFIENGQVTVNGQVIKEPYYRYQLGDVVTVDGNEVTIQERMVYVLLNKPKNVITTTEDEHDRPTVMDIVDPNYPERIYPVGRLDRDTTGLILLTNDGELAEKLTHPRHHVQKQYRVGLDQGLTREDYETIMKGIDLEDGRVEVSWIRFAEDHPMQDVIELEITMGRNRVVRRMFEALGYQVKRLDRFYYAGLTKKGLKRGGFRELTQREIIMLKHFSGNPPSSAIDGADTEGYVEEGDDDAVEQDHEQEQDQ